MKSQDSSVVSSENGIISGSIMGKSLMSFNAVTGTGFDNSDGDTNGIGELASGGEGQSKLQIKDVMYQNEAELLKNEGVI